MLVAAHQRAGVLGVGDHLLQRVGVFFAIEHRRGGHQVAAQPVTRLQLLFPPQVRREAPHVAHRGHATGQVQAQVLAIVYMHMQVKEPGRDPGAMAIDHMLTVSCRGTGRADLCNAPVVDEQLLVWQGSASIDIDQVNIIQQPAARWLYGEQVARALEPGNRNRQQHDQQGQQHPAKHAQQQPLQQAGQ